MLVGGLPYSLCLRHRFPAVLITRLIGPVCIPAVETVHRQPQLHEGHQHLRTKVTFLSSKVTFLSSKVTFLSSKLTFLSSKLTFLSSKLTFLSSRVRQIPVRYVVCPWIATVFQG